MSIRTTFLARLSAIALCCAAALPAAHAEGDFPSKPIIATVPFSPGGGNDILLRLLSKHAAPVLGQNLIVENKPGAGGQIGWTAIAKSRADGYSIGATSLPSMVILKALRPATPYALDDFHYVCNIQSDPVVWVVRADSPLKTAKDLAAQAMDAKKKVNVAGDGPQSNVQLQHLAAAKALGLQTNFISFNGSGPAITALLGGQVDVAASTLSAAMANIEAGKLRALVVFSDTPAALLPDVPIASKVFDKPIAPVGMAVRGLAAPKDVPADRLAKLEDACKKIVTAPAFVAEAKDLGIAVQYMGMADAEALVKTSTQEVESLKDLLKK
ncbi:Tripartite-type tricarboxylate transporter, receptor component TctC [Oryzisolibacter propanilivorax]|uniref:Tripartite-type tricarboxylate transporter, receptor component TctC n=1 Tax=Oryzisolibacter propanilivorax TaxID=1527607 RepID=A0A1G9QDF3_9BURK|nr:tripartite tricarboxylate transporter substrate binding protein [Oryzisolibacter propanilivorax]SDM09058.1 Tripartite-type tricarboxylate transporter, receptor component TctC [Oryzisolibacter propanilivorax]